MLIYWHFIFLYNNYNVTIHFNICGILFIKLGVWYCAKSMKKVSAHAYILSLNGSPISECFMCEQEKSKMEILEGSDCFQG